MATSSAQPEPSALAPSVLPSTSSGQPEGAFALPRPGALADRFSFPFSRVDPRPLAAWLGLWTLILGAIIRVAFTAAGPSVLVPQSVWVYPHWESGPLHALFSGLVASTTTLRVGFSILAIVMLVGFALVMWGLRTLSLRAIVICILALHAILLLGPPIQLNDVFNYLGYARLGGLHGLNPYNHVIANEAYDPVFSFASWRDYKNPYGPLFTAITYPLAGLQLSVAYWLVKSLTVAASLTVLGLIYKCARVLGRDPRYVLAFVALNPIYVVWAVGGFHNDFLMLIPALVAVYLVLTGRERPAGAILMLAVFIKPTAILLLPFMLLAIKPMRRRLEVLAGAVLAAIPLIVLSIGLFGLTIPNLQDQSRLLTNFSIPNVVGDLIGAGGGAPWLLHVGDVLVVATLLFMLRKRGDWISRAGWTTLALILSLAWLMPWYIVWLTPLAALGASPRLRKVTLALTAYITICYVPMTQIILTQHGLNPMSGQVAHASAVLQQELER